MISIFKKIIISLLNRFGYEIKKKSKDKITIENFSKIQSNVKKINVIESNIDKNGFSPSIFECYLQNLFTNLDNRFYESLKVFKKEKKLWLKKNGFDKFKLTFLHPKLFIGAFGNTYAAETIIRSQNLKPVNERNHLICILPKGTNFRNRVLSNYFSKYINFFKEEEIGINLDNNSPVFNDHGLHIDVSENEHFLDIASNRCEIEEKKNNYIQPIFELNHDHFEKGYKILNKFGLKKTDWFVTFHIRETGYRNETPKNTTQSFRNSNPQNFIEAIKFITKKGGWVIRVGDKSMSNLPKMKNVIDYAHADIKSEFMDIFLAAKSKFCVGTDSGYFRVPRFFGVPVILTNAPTSIIYYSLKSRDLYLPRLIKKKSENSYLNIKEMFSSPNSTLHFDGHFKKFNFEPIENTPDEIKSAVSEMLAKLENNNKHIQDNNQNTFKKISEEIGDGYLNKVTAFANCSSYFLKKHKKILI